MLRHICWSVAALLALYTTAGAQASPGFSGKWNGRAMVGANDSVVIVFALTIAPDGKSATMGFFNQDPVPARILAMGGDSMVTEAGPYQSVLRPREAVTTLRSVAHFKGDKMWGTFEAAYAKGETATGRIEATRAK
jgi:hypothetical protein